MGYYDKFEQVNGIFFDWQSASLRMLTRSSNGAFNVRDALAKSDIAPAITVPVYSELAFFTAAYLTPLQARESMTGAFKLALESLADVNQLSRQVALGHQNRKTLLATQQAVASSSQMQEQGARIITANNGNHLIFSDCRR